MLNKEDGPTAARRMQIVIELQFKQIQQINKSMNITVHPADIE